MENNICIMESKLMKTLNAYARLMRGKHGSF